MYVYVYICVCLCVCYVPELPFILPSLLSLTARLAPAQARREVRKGPMMTGISIQSEDERRLQKQIAKEERRLA